MINFIKNCYNKFPFFSGVSLVFIPSYVVSIYPNNMQLKEKEKLIELEKTKIIKEEQELDYILNTLINKNYYNDTLEENSINLLAEDYKEPSDSI